MPWTVAPTRPKTADFSTHHMPLLFIDKIEVINKRFFNMQNGLSVQEFHRMEYIIFITLMQMQYLF